MKVELCFFTDITSWEVEIFKLVVFIPLMWVTVKHSFKFCLRSRSGLGSWQEEGTSRLGSCRGLQQAGRVWHRQRQAHPLQAAELPHVLNVGKKYSVPRLYRQSFGEPSKRFVNFPIMLFVTLWANVNEPRYKVIYGHTSILTET